MDGTQPGSVEEEVVEPVTVIWELALNERSRKTVREMVRAPLNPGSLPLTALHSQSMFYV